MAYTVVKEGIRGSIYVDSNFHLETQLSIALYNITFDSISPSNGENSVAVYPIPDTVLNKVVMKEVVVFNSSCSYH